MDQMKLYKAIRPRDYNELETGKYNHKSVNVFYGFDGGWDDVGTVNEIAKAVAAEYPDILPEEMTVRIISAHESQRHAHQLTLSVEIPAETVCENLGKYTTL